MIKKFNYFCAFLTVFIFLIFGINFADALCRLIQFAMHSPVKRESIIILITFISIFMGLLFATPFYICACIVEIRDTSKEILKKLNKNIESNSDSNQNKNIESISENSQNKNIESSSENSQNKNIESSSENSQNIRDSRYAINTIPQAPIKMHTPYSASSVRR